MSEAFGLIDDDYRNQLYELRQSLETEGWTPSALTLVGSTPTNAVGSAQYTVEKSSSS